VLVPADLVDDPAGERLRPAEDDVAVDERQSLQRGRRHIALAVDLLRVRHVEGFEQGIGQAAPSEDVKAAARIVLRVLRGGPRRIRIEIAAPGEVSWDWREHARAADLLVELAGSDEDRVANLFRLETLAREHRDKLAVGIGLGDFLAGVRRLAIGGGKQNLAMQILHVPTIRHESGSQVVEQLLIARLVARLAEIADRGDDALAEILVPDTVDEDARRQWIARAHEPVGERGAPTRGAFERLDVGRLSGDRLGKG